MTLFSRFVISLQRCACVYLSCIDLPEIHSTWCSTPVIKLNQIADHGLKDQSSLSLAETQAWATASALVFWSSCRQARLQTCRRPFQHMAPLTTLTSLRLTVLRSFWLLAMLLKLIAPLPRCSAGLARRSQMATIAISGRKRVIPES